MGIRLCRRGFRSILGLELPRPIQAMMIIQALQQTGHAIPAPRVIMSFPREPAAELIVRR